MDTLPPLKSDQDKCPSMPHPVPFCLGDVEDIWELPWTMCEDSDEEIDNAHIPNDAALKENVVANDTTPKDAAPNLNGAANDTVNNRINHSALVSGLVNMIPFVMSDLEGGTATERGRFENRLVGNDRALIEQFYTRCVKWMRAHFPAMQQQLSLCAVPNPPGSPASLPDGQGHPVSPGANPLFGYSSAALHNALVRAGHLNVDITPGTSVIFGGNEALAVTEISRFVYATTWFQDATQAICQAQTIEQANVLSNFFHANGFDQFRPPTIADFANHPNPQQALMQALTNYVPAAMRAYNVIQTVRNYAQITLALNLGGPGHPALRELNQLGMNLHWNILTGQFTNPLNAAAFGTALPTSLEATPTNMARWAALEAWIASHRPGIEHVTLPIAQAARIWHTDQNYGSPECRYLQWGHANCPGNITIAGSIRHYDFIDHTFQVTQLPDGRIEVVRRATYYAYNAIPGTGITPSLYNFNATQVAQATYQAVSFAPNDLIACVNHFGNIEVIRADQLSNWQSQQNLMCNLTRYGAIAMDVGMVVTGFTALRGAWAAGSSLGRLVNAGRITIGLSGAFELNPQLQMLRDLALISDISLNNLSRRYSTVTSGLHALAGNPSLLLRAENLAGNVAANGGFAATLPIMAYSTIGNFSGMPGNQNALEQALRSLQENFPVNGQIFACGNPHIRAAVINIYRDYIQQLFGNNVPPEVQQIQQNLEQLLNAPLAQRQAYIAQLMALFRSSGQQISQLHASSQTETLTDADIRQGDFAANRQPNATQVAAAIAILLLATDEHGHVPAVLGTRTIQVPAFSFTYNDGSGESAETISSPGYEIRQSLMASDLLSFTRRFITVPGPITPARLAAAEALWHFGAISNAQLAAVYRDAITSGNPQLAMRALCGAPNGINLGTLIYEMQRQEALFFSTAHTPQEIAAYQAQNYGLTSQNLIQFLSSLSTQNPAVRAAVLVTRHAINPAVSGAHSANLLQSMSLLWHQHHNQPNTFVTSLCASIHQRFHQPPIALPAIHPLMNAGVADLVTQSVLIADTPDSSFQRQLCDALILVSVGPHAGGISSQLFNERLLTFVNDQNPAQTVIVLRHLRWDVLSLAQRIQIVNLLQNSATTENNEIVMLEIINHIPQLLTANSGVTAAALAPLRNQIAECLARMINSQWLPPQQSPIGQANTAANINPFLAQSEQVRLAAINQLGQLGIGSQSVIQALQNRIQWVPPSPGNPNGYFRDQSPHVRLAAVNALASLNPVNLLSLLQTAFAHESDPAVHQRIEQVRGSLLVQQVPNPIEVNQQFQQTLTNLLTPMANYHGPGLGLRSAYVLNNFPLLNQARRTDWIAAHTNPIASFIWQSQVYWPFGSEARCEQSVVNQLLPNRASSIWAAARNGNINAVRALADLIYTGALDCASSPETQLWLIEEAAQILRDLCGPGNPPAVRKLARGLVLDLLSQNHLNPAAEAILIQAVPHMGLSDAEAGAVYCMVLSKRINGTNLLPNHIVPPAMILPGESGYQSLHQVYLTCITQMRNLRYRTPQAIGLLLALADVRSEYNPSHDSAWNRDHGRSVDPAIRSAALDAYRYLMEGVLSSFDMVTSSASNQSAPTQRALAIAQARENLALGGTAYEILTREAALLEAIYRAVHGCPQVSTDSILVVTIARLMFVQPPNERVMLAAAHALLLLNMPAGPARRHLQIAALRCIAGIAMHGHSAALREDAEHVLGTVRAQFGGLFGIYGAWTYAASNQQDCFRFSMYQAADRIGVGSPGVFNTSQQAAVAMANALQPNRPANAPDAVTLICTACFAMPFQTNDLRITALLTGMQHQDARVRAACALMLLRRAGSHSVLATQALAQVVGNGSGSVRFEALQELDSFILSVYPQLQPSGGAQQQTARLSEYLQFPMSINVQQAHAQSLGSVVQFINGTDYRISLGQNRYLEVYHSHGMVTYAVLVQGTGANRVQLSVLTPDGPPSGPFMDGAMRVHNLVMQGPQGPQATPGQRSEAIESALENLPLAGNWYQIRAHEDNVIAAIYRAVRGCPQVASDSQLVATLVGVMYRQPPNERLMLAAASALCMLNIAPGNGRNQLQAVSLRTLAHIAIHGRLQSYRQEALQFLNQLSTEIGAANVRNLLNWAQNREHGFSCVMTMATDQAHYKPAGAVSPSAEATNIARALQPSCHDPVASICAACIGKPFVEDDPRTVQLLAGLNHANPRIRAICAVMILRHASGTASIANCRLAAQTLADIAATAPHPTLRAEALAELHRYVRATFPAMLDAQFFNPNYTPPGHQQNLPAFIQQLELQQQEASSSLPPSVIQFLPGGSGYRLLLPGSNRWLEVRLHNFTPSAAVLIVNGVPTRVTTANGLSPQQITQMLLLPLHAAVHP